MNKKLLAVIGGAFIMAVLVAMIVQATLAPKSKPAVEPETVEILIANRTLNKGELLKPQDVSWKAFPKFLSFTGVVKKSEQKDLEKLDVYNKVLLRDIYAGEPITTKALIMDIEGITNLSVKLEPGMRAVGISVKPETMAGGFIAPGDRVDVILTYQVRLKGEVAQYSPDAVQKYATETILTNARVLAVDQNDQEKSYKATVARTVTLEVTPEGAQKLNMASAMGSLSLALRRMGEKDTERDRNIPISTDVLDSKVIEHIYGEMKNDKAQANSVRVYNGSTIVDVPVPGSSGPAGR